MLLILYTLEPVVDVFCIFPLIHVEFMSKFFVYCLYNKFTQLSKFIFTRVISRTDGFFWKFLLWSFSVIKQLLSPLMPMRCITSLSFRMLLPLMLIFFLMLLFEFLCVEVMELFKRVLYWSLLNLYMLPVLSANVIVLSDVLIIFISCWSFFWNWSFTFLNFTFFTKAIKPFWNGASSFTFHRLLVDPSRYHSVWFLLPFPLL